MAGEWSGKDTALYLSLYDGLSFAPIDSIRTNAGRFLWQAQADPSRVYGISPDKRDRHPAPFVPDAATLLLRLWPGGAVTSRGSPATDLLQRSLATNVSFDTLAARHPDSPVTAFLALRLASALPYDTLAALRQSIRLPRRHPYARQLDATLEAMRRVHPGALAPPINGKTPEDSTLIVFHATWCPDCVAEWPRIRAYLSAHPTVTLTAVDIDSTGWDGDAPQAYAVRGVPAIFLIAGGKIQPLPKEL